ncbi:MAG: hypothetical protein PHG40_02950, partial [Candidatus Omnitrophica bacterium]|nr:hypothetical protein [Candidatus Omnitrophota bacterium]
EQKCGCGCASGKMIPCLFKVLLGLAFLVLGAMALLRWWGELLAIVKGCVGLFLILAGLITLAIAKE